MSATRYLRLSALRNPVLAWPLAIGLALFLPPTWYWLQWPTDPTPWWGPSWQWLHLPWLLVYVLCGLLAYIRQRLMEIRKDISHAVYAAAYKASPHPAGITSLHDGRFVDVNPILCRMLGLPRGQIVGRTNTELQIYATPNERQKLLDHLKAHGHVDSLRIICQSNGQLVPGTISATPLTIAGMACMMFVFHDLREQERAVQKIHAVNRLLQQAGHLARLGAWEDRRGVGLVYWSDVCYDIHGLPRSSLLPKDYLHTFVVPEHRERMRQQLQHCLRARTDWELEIQIVRADGRKLWVRTRGEAVLDEQGKITAMRGVMQDIDSYKQQAVSGREREALLAVTLEAAALGRWDWNLRTGHITGDTFWRSLNHLSQPAPHEGDESATHHWLWTELLAPADVQRCQAELQRHIAHPQDGPFVLTWQHPVPHGPVRWLRATGKIVSHDLAGNATRMLGVCQDVTEQQEQQHTLQQLAHFDPLTGLANRVELGARFQQALQLNRQSTLLMGVAYLDLDGFKPINDRLGHAAGDRLLILVAQRLQHTMRASDCVARLGGDEFVLLLNQLNSRAECEALLQRLMQQIAQPYTLDDESVWITASIGYTLHPEDESDADMLIRHADQAMYQAKQAGRNRIQAFDARLDRSQRESLSKGKRIQDGLHNHEFQLHVQPKVDMHSGKVIGVEALARWQHPQHGLLTPQHFLPHIEGSELEITFGQWSVVQALRILSEFMERGLEIPLAVNLSPTYLQQPNFTQWMAQQLANFPHIPPRLLDLEITENAALHDMQKVSQTLQQLRALGVSISLDDFGTGYSSLTYLSQLPLDCLKIDRSFVQAMLTDHTHSTIVHGVIGLARALGYKVIAEGVENQAQCTSLTNMGCHWAQGFYFARPMPVDAFYLWMQHRPPAPESPAHQLHANI